MFQIGIDRKLKCRDPNFIFAGPTPEGRVRPVPSGGMESAILFYGVLPRFILWGFCKRNVYRQCKKVLRAHPEADGIYRRLAGQTVSTRALEAEGNADHLIAEDFDDTPAAAQSVDQRGLSLVNWAQIACSDAGLIACLYPDNQTMIAVSRAGGLGRSS